MAVSDWEISQDRKNYFVPGGQSTQLIVGATPESDYQMVAVAEALYRNFGLKRVFYSAFIKVNEDSLLPDSSGRTAASAGNTVCTRRTG